MHIEIRADRQLEDDQTLDQEVQAAVQEALGRFGDRIQRVEVHLRDENARWSGPEDKRCLIETRAERMEPIVASHAAPTVPEAVDGACGKVQRSLEKKVERR